MQATNPDNFVLDNHLAQIREYIIILETAATDLNQDLIEYKDKLDMKDNKLDQAQKNIDSLQKQLDDKCNELKNLQDNNTNKFGQLEDEIKKLKE